MKILFSLRDMTRKFEVGFISIHKGAGHVLACLWRLCAMTYLLSGGMFLLESPWLPFTSVYHLAFLILAFFPYYFCTVQSSCCKNRLQGIRDHSPQRQTSLVSQHGQTTRTCTQPCGKTCKSCGHAEICCNKGCGSTSRT